MYLKYVTYSRSMVENVMPLPYDEQEMTTARGAQASPGSGQHGRIRPHHHGAHQRRPPARRIVPEEDSWVYSPAWQEKLRDAEADLAAARVQRFADDDEFLTHLEALDDQAGG
jgi:hypothetical protein